MSDPVESGYSSSFRSENALVPQQPSSNETCTSSSNNDDENREKQIAYAKETLTKIRSIKRQVKEVKLEIEAFDGTREDDRFGIFDELLIKHTISLDNIDTRNIQILRDARRKVIMYVQECQKLLDSKVMVVHSDFDEEDDS